MLSGVESDNLDKCESCRSVKLIKPPSLDKVHVASIKLAGVDTFLVLQARYDVSGEGSLHI